MRTASADPELPVMADLYLEDSFVLGIEATPGELRIAIDVVLTERHDQYRPTGDWGYIEVSARSVTVDLEAADPGQ